MRLDEAAVEKRLTRARQVLREEHVELELDGVPDGELAVRLDGVLRTLYVLFLEGYSAHAGDTQIDEELCRTAIRLNAMLLASRFTTPRGDALQALFLLQTARLVSRVDAAGDLIPLDRQDRGALGPRDDRRGARTSRARRRRETSCHRIISRPRSRHATRSRRPTLQPIGRRLSRSTTSCWRSHLRRSSLCNARSRSGEPTVRAPGCALEGLVGNDRLEDDPVLAAAIGELEAQRGNVRAARTAYRRALELAGTAPERRFLEERLAAL